MNVFRKYKKQPANAGQSILRSLGFDDNTLALIPDEAYDLPPTHCLPCPYKRRFSPAPYGPYGTQKG